MWRVWWLMAAAVLSSCMVSCDREMEGEITDPGQASLRAVFLPLDSAEASLWLDDELQVVQPTAPWIGPRREVLAGSHRAVVTLGTQDPHIVFDRRFLVPAGGDFTHIVSGVSAAFRGYLAADSNLAESASAVIRHVNVHATDTVVMAMEYQHSIEYLSHTPPGQSAPYEAVIPWSPAGDPTYHISLGLHQPGFDLSLPVDDLLPGGVYTVYTFGVDPAQDPARALRATIVEDYPPDP